MRKGLQTISLAATVVLFIGAKTAADENKVKILITAFEPFQGPSNSSMRVAEELKRLNVAQNDVIYELCTLPVDYERAFTVAKSCFDGSAPPKPKVVLSLGEGTDRLKVETKMQNLDDNRSADNVGQTREHKVIDPSAPKEELLTLPVAEMLCASNQFLEDGIQKKITLSVSAGNYVCNHAAFLMSRHLRKLHIPFGFIHVPDEMTFLYAENSQQTAGRIHAMMRALSGLNPVDNSPPDCRKNHGLRQHSQAILNGANKVCLQQVRNRLEQLEWERKNHLDP